MLGKFRTMGTEYRLKNILWIGILVPYLCCCTAYPIHSESKDSINILPESNSSLLAVVLVVGTIVCTVTVVVGCMCCQNGAFKHPVHENLGFESVSNGREHDGYISASSPGTEFTIFPPRVGQHAEHHGSLNDIKFDPLPDIRPRGRTSSGSQRPRPANFSNTINQGLSVEDWFEDPSSNFPRHQLQYLQEVGSGWFGQVVEGEAQGISRSSKKMKVVVKILREDATPTDQIYFLHEVKAFRDLNHANVIKLLGKCLETDPFLIILEHCAFKDLKTYLIQHRTESESLIQGNLLLRMAVNVAAGLQHMHANNFIHTDISARNCLVGTDLQVKIGDYGNSIEKFKEDYYCAADVAVPIRWCAPETLRCTETTIETKEVTREANIWSFGVLVWEILEFGKLPYAEWHEEDVLQKVVIENSLQLNQPMTDCAHKDKIFQVMQLCWLFKPKLRPNMEKVHAMLTHLHAHCDNSRSPTADFESRWRNLQPRTARVTNIPSAGGDASVADSLSPQQSFESDFTAVVPPTSPSPHPSLSFDGDFAPQGSPLSPSLQNLRGSLEELSTSSVTITGIAHATSDGNLSSPSLMRQSSGKAGKFESMLKPRSSSVDVGIPGSSSGRSVQKEFDAWLAHQQSKGIEESAMAKEISDAIVTLDAAIGDEKGTSSSEGDSSANTSPERDLVRSRPEGASGEFLAAEPVTQLVREKSQSVQDFLTLTVIDNSDNSDESGPPSVGDVKVESKAATPQGGGVTIVAEVHRRNDSLVEHVDLLSNIPVESSPIRKNEAETELNAVDTVDTFNNSSEVSIENIDFTLVNESRNSDNSDTIDGRDSTERNAGQVTSTPVAGSNAEGSLWQTASGDSAFESALCSVSTAEIVNSKRETSQVQKSAASFSLTPERSTYVTCFSPDATSKSDTPATEVPSFVDKTENESGNKSFFADMLKNPNIDESVLNLTMTQPEVKEAESNLQITQIDQTLVEPVIEDLERKKDEPEVSLIALETNDHEVKVVESRKIEPESKEAETESAKVEPEIPLIEFETSQKDFQVLTSDKCQSDLAADTKNERSVFESSSTETEVPKLISVEDDQDKPLIDLKNIQSEFETDKPKPATEVPSKCDRLSSMHCSECRTEIGKLIEDLVDGNNSPHIELEDVRLLDLDYDRAETPRIHEIVITDPVLPFTADDDDEDVFAETKDFGAVPAREERFGEAKLTDSPVCETRNDCVMLTPEDAGFFVDGNKDNAESGQEAKLNREERSDSSSLSTMYEMDDIDEALENISNGGSDDIILPSTLTTDLLPGLLVDDGLTISSSHEDDFDDVKLELRSDEKSISPNRKAQEEPESPEWKDSDFYRQEELEDTMVESKSSDEEPLVNILTPPKTPARRPVPLDAVILEDLDTPPEKTNSRLSHIVRSTSDDIADDILLVDVETNEIVMFPSEIPCPHLAFTETIDRPGPSLAFMSATSGSLEASPISESVGSEQSDDTPEATNARFEWTDPPEDVFDADLMRMVEMCEAAADSMKEDDPAEDEILNVGNAGSDDSRKSESGNVLRPSVELLSLEPESETTLNFASTLTLTDPVQSILPGEPVTSSPRKSETEDDGPVKCVFQWPDSSESDESDNEQVTSFLADFTPEDAIPFWKQIQLPSVDRTSTPESANYPPDWESDSEASSQSASSTSGEFDCSRAGKQSPARGKSSPDGAVGNSASSTAVVRVSTWDKDATPTRSALKTSPEKRSSDFKKSVSFEIQKNPLIYEYPKEKQWDESPTRMVWNASLFQPSNINYADWELGEDEIPEDIVEVEDFDEMEEFHRMTDAHNSYPLSSSAGRLGENILYKLSDISDEYDSSLDENDQVAFVDPQVGPITYRELYEHYKSNPMFAPPPDYELEDGEKLVTLSSPTTEEFFINDQPFRLETEEAYVQQTYPVDYLDEDGVEVTDEGVEIKPLSKGFGGDCENVEQLIASGDSSSDVSPMSCDEKSPVIEKEPARNGVNGNGCSSSSSSPDLDRECELGVNIEAIQRNKLRDLNENCSEKRFETGDFSDKTANVEVNGSVVVNGSQSDAVVTALPVKMRSVEGDGSVTSSPKFVNIGSPSQELLI